MLFSCLTEDEESIHKLYTLVTHVEVTSFKGEAVHSQC